jgi:beta-xylosidase
MVKAFEEIIQRENALYKAYQCNIPEACGEWNDLQSEKIEVAFNHYGKVFIGKINFYGDEHQNLTVEKIFVEYTGGTVYNFAAAFVIPAEDAELAEMIVKWNKNGLPTSLELIEKITARIEALGGMNLTWT